MSNLTRDDVLRATDTKTFGRGRLYYEQGRVQGLTRIDKGDGFQRFESQVRGSSGKIYAQRVLIALHPRHAVISGVCDCPVGYACKHVVAGCLAYLDDATPGPGTAPTTHPGTQAEPPEAIKGWFHRVAIAADRPIVEETGERLLYLLQPAPSDAHAVAVELAVVRPLKGGGLSKGRRLNLANFLYSHGQHGYVLPVDRDILAILRGISAGGWAPSLSLHGPLGQIALHRMVATGRCHWRASDTAPLSEGPTQDLAPAWREFADGALRLELAPNAQLRVILTDPPLYLDGEAHRVGPLDTQGLTLRQLRELAAAPAMRRQQAEAISRLLTLEYPQLPLPTPVPLAVTEVTGTPAVPWLRLAARDGGHVGNAGAASNLAAEALVGTDTHVILLDFDYAGHRVPGSPCLSQSIVRSPGGAVRVHRDGPAEAIRPRATGRTGLRPPAGTGGRPAAPPARRGQPHRARHALVRLPARGRPGPDRRRLAGGDRQLLPPAIRGRRLGPGDRG